MKKANEGACDQAALEAFWAADEANKLKAFEQLQDPRELMRRKAVKSKRDVTGRDGYIIAQALAYAITTIQSLPEERQEFSNMCDMLAILKTAFSPRLVSMVVGSATRHTALPINLLADIEAEETAAA